jgi:hypothetical protein
MIDAQLFLQSQLLTQSEYILSKCTTSYAVNLYHYIVPHADFPSVLLDFNHYRDLSTEFSKSGNVSNNKNICPVGTVLFHAG